MTMADTGKQRKLSAQEVLTEFRRNEIIDAAYALARKEGFSRLTVERVAERAGVSKGTIYTYFSDKADLIGVMINAVGEEVLRSAREAADVDGPVRERLLNFARILEQQAHKHRELFRYVHQPGEFNGQSCPCDSVEQQTQSQMFIAIGAEIVADGVRRGELRDVDPGTVSFFLLCSLQDYLLRDVLTPGLNIAADVEYLVDLYLRGIQC